MANRTLKAVVQIYENDLAGLDSIINSLLNGTQILTSILKHKLININNVAKYYFFYLAEY